MTFITRDNKLIYPELKINQRLVAEGKSKAAGGKPSKRVFSDIDLQTWCYNKVQSTSFIHFSSQFPLSLGWLYLQ